MTAIASASPGLLGSGQPLNKAYDVALVDLDGVAYRGPDAIPTAPPALAAARAAGMTLVFVTNNANREPEAVAAHLSELGMPCAPGEVLTAAQAAATMLAERLRHGATVLVVGGVGLRTAVAAKGFVVTTSAADAPAAVVQGFSPEVAWPHLAEAAYAIQAGAWFLASNLDKTLPNERGFAPGNGSLVEAVRTAAGVDPASAGKPEPTMFLQAASQTGAERPLAIGDRLDTDLAGARAAGFDGLLVLTGVSTALDAIKAPPEHRPSYIGETLECLAVPHPVPAHHEGAWTVGEATARVERGTLTAAGGTFIDRVRAACAAAWEAVDAGSPLEEIVGVGVAS